MANRLSTLKNREVYILQVWQPKGKDATLKGQIHHVHSGEVFPIREPGVILSLIHKQAELAGRKNGSSGIK